MNGRYPLAAAVVALALASGMAVALARPPDLGSAVTASLAAVAFAAGLMSQALAGALFLYTGLFKTADTFGAPDSPWPTLAVVVLVGVAALRSRNGIGSATIWAVTLTPAVIYLLLNSWLIAPDFVPAVTKWGRFVALGVVPSVLAVAVFQTQFQRARLITAIALLGAPFALYACVRAVIQGVPAGGLQLFGENTVILGRSMAVAFLSAAAVSLDARGFTRLSYMVIAALALTATFLSASRGAALGAVTAFLALVVLTRHLRVAVAVAVAGGAGLALLASQVTLAPVLERYLSLADPQLDPSTVERLALLVQHKSSLRRIRFSDSDSVRSCSASPRPHRTMHTTSCLSCCRRPASSDSCWSPCR